jgi:hypothetical protein
MKMRGYTFPYRGKDVFIITRKKLRNERLCSQIIKAINDNLGVEIPDNPDVRADLKFWLQKATCEIRTLPSGRQYYEIAGENFGGKGSFIDDGKTIILKLD